MQQYVLSVLSGLVNAGFCLRGNESSTFWAVVFAGSQVVAALKTETLALGKATSAM